MHTHKYAKTTNPHVKYWCKNFYLIDFFFFFLPNTQLQSVNQLVTSQRANVEKCSHKFTLLKNEVKSLSFQSHPRNST